MAATAVQRHTVEQIIETFVPVQILDGPVPPSVGQLVNVLKIIDVSALRNSWWKCQQSFSSSNRPLTFQFRVCGGGRRGELQGPFPGQSPTATSCEDLRGFHPGQGGGLRIRSFLPEQGSTAPSSFSRSPTDVLDDADEQFEGFFALFPWPKKSATVTRQSSARVPGHSSSSAHQTLVRSAHGVCWLNVITSHTQWHPPWEV